MKQIDWKQVMRQTSQKLGKFKYPMLILLLGLILLAIPTGRDEPETAETPVDPVAEPAPAEESESLPDIETRLEQILSRIDGAGRVEVMLCYAAGSRTVYQTDNSQEVDTGDESSKTRMEVSTVLATDADGAHAPVRVQTIFPTFQGALVVAEGAENAAVRLNLVSAVSSLTGLGADKITVIKMKSE